MSKAKPEEQQGPDEVGPELDQCFIITPIGESNSDIYNKAMGLIDAVIKPVLEEFNFKPVAANHMSAPGSINRQLLKAILEDKLVIANLTGLNPNVMYELAVRHAARLPVVIMTEKGTRLPFDITDQRTIFYEDSLAGLGAAKNQLREMVAVAIKEDMPDNPIYQAVEQASIFKELSPSDPMKVVIERLSTIEDKLSLLKIRSNSSGDDNIVPNRYAVSDRNFTVNFKFIGDLSAIESNVEARRLINYLTKISDNINGIKIASLSQRGTNDCSLSFKAPNKAIADLFIKMLSEDENIELLSNSIF